MESKNEYYLCIEIEGKYTYCKKTKDVVLKDLHQDKAARYYLEGIEISSNKRLSDHFDKLGVNWDGKITIKLPSGSL